MVNKINSHYVSRPGTKQKLTVIKMKQTNRHSIQKTKQQASGSAERYCNT